MLEVPTMSLNDTCFYVVAYSFFTTHTFNSHDTLSTNLVFKPVDVVFEDKNNKTYKRLINAVAHIPLELF